MELSDFLAVVLEVSFAPTCDKNFRLVWTCERVSSPPSLRVPTARGAIGLVRCDLSAAEQAASPFVRLALPSASTWNKAIGNVPTSAQRQRSSSVTAVAGACCDGQGCCFSRRAHRRQPGAIDGSVLRACFLHTRSLLVMKEPPHGAHPPGCRREGLEAACSSSSALHVRRGLSKHFERSASFTNLDVVAYVKEARWLDKRHTHKGKGLDPKLISEALSSHWACGGLQEEPEPESAPVPTCSGGPQLERATSASASGTSSSDVLHVGPSDICNSFAACCSIAHPAAVLASNPQAVPAGLQQQRQAPLILPWDRGSPGSNGESCSLLLQQHHCLPSSAPVRSSWLQGSLGSAPHRQHMHSGH